MSSVDPPKRLLDKAALVTGASRGIGRAIAIALAGEGASVVLVSRIKKDLESVADAIRHAGGVATVLPADLTEEDQIVHLMQQVRKQWGRLDILVNNAGVVYSGPLEQTRTEQWEACMALNAKGPLVVSRSYSAASYCCAQPYR